ncbi:MAG: hypothetical protein AB7U23_11345 [Dehalococcoidia bacterium]
MVADADPLDAVYRVFAEHLQLPSDQNRRELVRKRGIPKSVRERMPPLLCSLPPYAKDDRILSRRLAEELRRRFPLQVLARVPDLAIRRGNGLLILDSQRGARHLEPWHDEHGRIVALRGYHPGTDNKYKTTYRRTGPMLHFAYGVPRSEIADCPWLFTEAWMKAEVAAHMLGCVAVSFAGTQGPTAWERALEVKRELAPLAPSYVAFDAEVWTTKPYITTRALTLAKLMRWREDRLAGFAVWDTPIERGAPRHKGIDDALVAGLTVDLLDWYEFAPVLAQALRRWKSDVAA